MYTPNENRWLAPAIVVSSLLILWIDIITPRGSAEYIFYFIPVAFTIYHHRENFPFQTALFASILSFIGWYFSPSSNFEFQVALKNRTYSIIAMWAVAYLVRITIQARNQNLTNDWLKMLATRLLDSVRGELTTKEIAQNILRFLHSEVHTLVGAVYVRKGNSDQFEFITGHGVDEAEVKKTIRLGEGITGQVAIDQIITNVTDLPGNHLKLKTVISEVNPGAVKIVPLVVDGRTIGLIELGFKEHPDASIREFFKLNVENLAIAIRSAQHKEKLAELLAQSQQDAEELQAQQEELRVVNEELEQQSKALKESHSRMENQQAELEQTNQQLEEQAQTLENQKNLLDERNRDLINIQMDLEQKAHELEKSSQYKSEFLANMSHELRTPLNSTLILARLLADNKDKNLNQEQVKYAEIIYNSGNDLLNLINDILDLSKVEAGKLTINPEQISLPAMVKSLEDVFMPLAKTKGLSLDIQTASSLPIFISDRQRVEQILKNFLSNALKFTSQGSVGLRVRHEENKFIFEVEDTGLGITPEQQRVIFEAFRQADGTTNRRFGGTGLGLSISKELAKILGGEIRVKSEKGKGSIFSLIMPEKFSPETVDLQKVELPRPVAPTPTRKKSPPIKEELTVPASSFSFEDDRKTLKEFARRILIVEDDENFARILYDLSHEMNFGSVVASTAEEGIQFAKTFQPHAIVLDIRLPDHSGMVVLDQLKMDPKTRHIPVHVISSEDFSRSALEMGAVGYMLKPVRREQLLEAFNHMTSLMDQKTRNVLVVEDDLVQREHIVGLIAESTVHVEAVDTAQKALEKLAKKTYDCMIMDLSLPDMSGHELLDRLSQENATSSFPPVIVYTARDLTRSEEEQLRQYSGSIIIKGAKSPERLLSEVTLFLHRVETEMPPERQKMLVDLRSREKNLEGRKILIVDDDVRNIFALTSALEGLGAKIETARNGVEALEKLDQEQNGIELVLMDIMMPEMDGYEAMRRIRLIKKFEHLPIIALTAKAMSDDKEKCIAMGANDYLSKPIVMDRLLSLIRVWLPSRRKFNV